jgi:quinol monooxygenase YgiN
VVIEAYVDETAFSSHMATEHNRLFNEAVAEHIEGGRSSLVWLTPALGGP